MLNTTVDRRRFIRTKNIREDNDGNNNNYKRRRRSVLTTRRTFLLITLLLVLFLSRPCCSSVNDDDDDDDSGRKKKKKKKKTVSPKVQLRRDERKVQRILTASAQGQHYKVLGLLQNWELRVWGGRYYVPLFRSRDSHVRQAYRKSARLVHPDKNKSSRAAEAFDALDRAAAILQDEALRRDYDGKIRERRTTRHRERVDFTRRTVRVVIKNVQRVASVGYRVLGPFKTPIIVLGVLMF